MALLGWYEGRHGCSGIISYWLLLAYIPRASAIGQIVFALLEPNIYKAASPDTFKPDINSPNGLHLEDKYPGMSRGWFRIRLKLRVA